MEIEPIQKDGLKRAFDIVFSLFVLVAFSPLFLLVALVVRLTSKGPIFFRSKRFGQGGIIIDCLKFRTMYSDAEARLEELLQSDKKLREEWDLYYKLKDDPRITPVGKFLRKSSLDELPQFYNVLKGDLSIVGPRAPALTALPENYFQEIRLVYGDYAPKILAVKPGITGVWQISGRSHIPLEKKRELEADYAQTRTFRKDLVVIAKTIPAVLFRKGAC